MSDTQVPNTAEAIETSPATPLTEKQKADAKRQKEYEANRKALDELCELYPEAFNPKTPKPLQIGIHETIAADGKLSKTRIRRALNLYVRLRSYIACLAVEGAERVSIDGSPTAKVSADEAQHAQTKLAEIDARRAARKPKKPAPAQKPARRAAAPAKKEGSAKKPSRGPRVEKPAVVEQPVESDKDAEQRLQSKLAALVNKRSN